jgi:lysophospholipase L1-like esterase
VTSFAEHVRSGGGRTLSVFGDSITAGASVGASDRWANRLAALTGLELRNKGISGTVLQGSPDADGQPRPDNGYSRFRRDLLGHDRSDYLAILYGTNDARHTGSPETLNHDGFLRDYRAMLSGLIAEAFAPASICIGSPAHIPDAGFAVGDPEFAGQDRHAFQAYVGTVRELAREFGTFYAPVNETMQARGGDALVLPDHVHPNPAGHAVIADAFAAATHIH